MPCIVTPGVMHGVSHIRLGVNDWGVKNASVYVAFNINLFICCI